MPSTIWRTFHMNSRKHIDTPIEKPATRKATALMSLSVLTSLVAASLLPLPSIAQEPASSRLGQRQVHEIVERISTLLTERYVFPDVGNQIAAVLRNAERRGAFAALATPKGFADSVTTLLRSTSHDGHLWIEVSPGEYPEPAARPDTQDAAVRRRRLRAMNFGFPRVEILPGNVGYIQVSQFVTPEIASDAAAAAFRFLANADALIVDLRGSGGGSAEMVALISCYLFDAAPVHLFDIYRRPQRRLDEYRTDRFAPSVRLARQPVYVLTNAALFSAGEGLAYTLKDLHRVTVVGEKTSGGAHLGSFHRVSEHLVMFLAEARAISAASGTNWQGVGVTPDVPVAAELALDTAHLLALETLLQSDTADVMVGQRQQAAQEIRLRLRSAPARP
jgi:retinol-binding protein 3